MTGEQTPGHLVGLVVDAVLPRDTYERKKTPTLIGSDWRCFQSSSEALQEGEKAQPSENCAATVLPCKAPCEPNILHRTTHPKTTIVCSRMTAAIHGGGVIDLRPIRPMAFERRPRDDWVQDSATRASCSRWEYWTLRYSVLHPGSIRCERHQFVPYLLRSPVDPYSRPVDVSTGQSRLAARRFVEASH